MARNNPTIVRLEDKKDQFFKLCAKKDRRPPGTLAYLIMDEWLEEHGYSEWLKEDKTSLAPKITK